MNFDGVTDETKEENDIEPQASNVPPAHLQEAPEVSYGLTSPSANIATASSNTIDLNHIWPSKSMVSEHFVRANCIDTSHFDMNLRKIKSQSKERQKQKKEEQMQKSKVVRKLKELLVLKTESGENVYKITKPSEDNLQIITFEEDDNKYV